MIEKLIQENGRLMQHIYIDEEFNFSRINNIAAESANGEFILLLNNDIVFESKNPILEMLKYFIYSWFFYSNITFNYLFKRIVNIMVIITATNI